MIANHITIEQLLDSVCAGTGLNYAIDAAGRIFITKRFSIQTKFPRNFLFTGTRMILVEKRVFVDYQKRDTGLLQISFENKLFEVGIKSNQPNATIAGYVRDARSGEAIIGASVYVDTPSVGVNTDQFGYFSLTLPTGYRVLKDKQCRHAGNQRQVMLNGNGELNIDMQVYIPSLKSVTVKAERNL